MNNILTFEDYKKMNIRQVESVIYHQFIEEDIKEDNLVNEGIIRNAINKMSSKFIQTALADEIEKGKELEKSIKEALDGLDKGFEEIKKGIDKKSKNNSELDAIEKVKEAIKAVQSQAFDTLTMIGSEGEIDFAGFMGSATVAAATNFGILFTPIRSLFITRKAYKYFLGIIKQTIRRNLLIIQLNFDQFENLILQKSFENNDDSELITMNSTLSEIISAMQTELCGKDSKLKLIAGRKHNEMKDYLNNFQKIHSELIKNRKENAISNPYNSLWSDQHNNTYTRTLEQIKQYINDDSQKELDALKNSITKMAGNDVELIPYGELLISAAEEYAIHTNHGINNNFIKMSSVFNLENQKKLIDLIVETQKENEKEIEKKKKEIDIKEVEEKLKKDIVEGKKLYEEKLKDSTEVYTIDKFEDEFSESDIKSLKAFFNSEEGKEPYKELTDKNPLYKYLIDVDMKVLNDFLSAINDLKIIEIQDMDDFFDKIVKKEQTLYYLMAERSIKDAVKSNTPNDYFGFDIDEDSDVDTKDNVLSEKAFEKETTTSGDKTTNFSKVDILFNNIIKTSKNKTGRGYSFNKKSKYFLTFNGSGNNLFNILHNDFKTDFFKEDGEYKSEISIDSKLDIMKLIYKNLKIGKSISTQFAEYLSILETHMLLKEPEKSWFVIKNNEGLKDCFDTDSKKIVNKHAFVEISDDDFSDIKTFLTKYHSLSDNDFNIVEADKKENE